LGGDSAWEADSETETGLGSSWGKVTPLTRGRMVRPCEA
jgi:hypothetical protein